MRHFFEIQRNLIKKTPILFKRFLFDKIDFSNRLICIVGPRGVGKTTLLLQHLKSLEIPQDQYLYVSLDDIYFSENKLVDFVQSFIENYDGKLIVLDEVHKYPNWNQELKNIYDRYHDLKIIFSGSSTLDLAIGNYDLSRRASRYYLPGMSFREYLKFSQNLDFSDYSLKEILKNHVEIANDIHSQIKPLKEIKKYLKFGYFPYYRESNEIDYYSKLNLTIEKTIYMDIANFYLIKTNYLKYFSKIIYYLATIPPGKINVNNISKHLKISNETTSDYLEYLKNSSIIRYLYIDALGSKLIRNAEKVFLDNTNILHSVSHFLDKSINNGQIRELFVLNQLQNSGKKVFYNKIGDLSVADFNFEIGGKNKDWKQLIKNESNFLILDEISIGTKNEIPMYLFGFLY